MIDMDAFQGELNEGKVDPAKVKELIHLFNVRGQVFNDLFILTAGFRRRHNKETFTHKDILDLLVFVRKASYAMLKLRRN